MSQLEYSASLTAEEYCRLRAAVGWPELPLEEAREELSHSAFVAACHKGGGIIGAVRIVWDHGYIAYFSDLMVLAPGYREGACPPRPRLGGGIAPPRLENQGGAHFHRGQ